MNDLVRDNFLQHHGILGQKWGIRRYQPYPKGYHGDGKFTGKLTRDQKLSKKNIKNAETANLEKFGKDREHNVLYIAGYSGSGKSTMASGIAKKNDKIIRLDFYADPVNRETRGLRDKEFNQFLDKKGISRIARVMTQRMKESLLKSQQERSTKGRSIKTKQSGIRR